MYRVNGNQKVINSCTILYESLLELLQVMPLMDITISALCRKSGVSRATFYEHFDRPIDILRWQVDLHMAESFKDSKPVSNDATICFTKSYYAYWVEQWQLLEVLVRHNVYPLFVDALARAFKVYFGPIIDLTDISPNTRPYLLHIYPSVTASILQTWIVEGRKESAEKLASISAHNNIFPDYRKK